METGGLCKWSDRGNPDNDENWYVYSKAGLKLFKLLRKVLSSFVVCVHITNM